MKIHCSGIGGIGLSAYAALQKSSGHIVSGSDRAEMPLTLNLREQGIFVSLQQDGSAIPKDADLFVYSEAIPSDCPERILAKEYGMLQQSYFQALGNVSLEYETVIAVCGTHGKSTTTAMAAHALLAAGKDPTVIVGTKVPVLDGKNWRKGGKKILLVEACEYRCSFLHLHPTMILLTNVDWDHVDAFPLREEYEDAFVQFVQKLPSHGHVITHMQECADVLLKAGCENFIDADGISRLQEPKLWGKHMRDNSRLVIALCHAMDISPAGLLDDFQGCWRRIEEKGQTKHGALVIDDYAHHPKEIMATVVTMREKYPDRRLICVFQPHMFDRIVHFYVDFTKAFLGTCVLLADIYEARGEQGKQTQDFMETFARDISNGSGTDCRYVGSHTNLQVELDKILQPQDVVLCMGAGDITNLSSSLTAIISEPACPLRS